jgi:hypothetical protein
MKKILSTPKYRRSFKRLRKKYPSLPADYREFEAEYLRNPHLGTDLGGGFRKVRLMVRSKGSGKRGGLRIITYDVYLRDADGVIILVDIYDKSDRESIRESEYRSTLEQFLSGE